MKKPEKRVLLQLISVIICTVIVIGSLSPVSFAAKKFAPVINSNNIGVTTQYQYSQNNPSWLRQLTVKEDMLSTEGIASEAVLYPITPYPYRTDAPCFKEEVDEYTETFTLDEESRKAAYVYLLNQLGALSLITEPPTDGLSKADWLRNHGIIITEEQENDPDCTVMINALYSLMRNDLYYVLKGKHLNIPDGTTLESAVLFYLMALSEKSSTLTAFIQKYFGETNIFTLEDYIYYTSLLTLFTNGYVSIVEIPTISRSEVYKRLAVMAIREHGFAVDADASEEEIQMKYLASMLGEVYDVSLDPDALIKEVKKDRTAYYIVRRMVYEDASITVSTSKYTYEQAFNIALKQTHRFDLENRFYSDITSYKVYLKNFRDSIYVNPNPITASGTQIKINNTKVENARYYKVLLTKDNMQNIDIAVTNKTGNQKQTTHYTISVYQGTAPAEKSDLTGFIESMGNVSIAEPVKNVVETVIDALGEPVSLMNEELPEMYHLAQKTLTLNANGQLVDENGNVVSDKSYEPLPEGYRYTLDSAGKIVVVKAEDETETTTEAPVQSSTEEFDRTRIVIIICISIVILLGLGIAIILIRSKSKKSKKDYKSRKAKEKKKQEKKQAKKDKKKK